MNVVTNEKSPRKSLAVTGQQILQAHTLLVENCLWLEHYDDGQAVETPSVTLQRNYDQHYDEHYKAYKVPPFVWGISILLRLIGKMSSVPGPCNVLVDTPFSHIQLSRGLDAFSSGTHWDTKSK